MKIKHEHNQSCPFGQQIEGVPIVVNSAACHNCEHLYSVSNNEVDCRYEEDEEGNQEVKDEARTW
jgi:hypothetical protein